MASRWRYTYQDPIKCVCRSAWQPCWTRLTRWLPWTGGLPLCPGESPLQVLDGPSRFPCTLSQSPRPQVDSLVEKKLSRSNQGRFLHRGRHLPAHPWHGQGGRGGSADATQGRPSGTLEVRETGVGRIWKLVNHNHHKYGHWAQVTFSMNIPTPESAEHHLRWKLGLRPVCRF